MEHFLEHFFCPPGPCSALAQAPLDRGSLSPSTTPHVHGPTPQKDLDSFYGTYLAHKHLWIEDIDVRNGMIAKWKRPNLHFPKHMAIPFEYAVPASIPTPPGFRAIHRDEHENPHVISSRPCYDINSFLQTRSS